MQLSSVNASKTTFCLFEFPPSFFTIYHQSHCIQMKILIKPMLSVLKANLDMDKLMVFLMQDRLVFEFMGRGIKKVHKFVFEEQDALKALYLGAATVNHATIRPKVMNSWLQHLSLKEDVIINSSPLSFSLRSGGDALATLVDVDVSDFTSYQITRDGEIILALKDFKTVVQLGDACGVELALQWGTPGTPLVVKLLIQSILVEFVIATVDNEDAVPCSPPRQSVPDSPRKNTSSIFAALQSQPSVVLNTPTTPRIDRFR